MSIVFSVVIPVYNKKPHIKRCIKSVLSQTFNNYEIICVDDASTDGSKDVLNEFNSDSIQVISRTEPGPGGYAARNEGIMNARGEWIAFLDADDEWLPDHLANLFAFISRNPNIKFLSSGWCVYESGSISENSFYKSFKQDPRVITLIEYLSFFNRTGRRPVWTSVACIAKNSPLAQGLFPSESGAQRGGDIYAWLKLVCYHRQLGWVNYIGAKYHRDSVNMVTKTSPSSIELYSDEIFSELSIEMDFKEKKLLARYFNIHLRNIWFNNLLNKKSNFCIRNHLFWNFDFTYSFCIYIASKIPPTIFILLLRVRNSLRFNRPT